MWRAFRRSRRRWLGTSTTLLIRSSQWTFRPSFTVPANASHSVPIVVEFGGFGPGFGRRGGILGPRGDREGLGLWEHQSEQHSADNNKLLTGLSAHEQGAATQARRLGGAACLEWGVSRMIDYFEANRDSRVERRKLGLKVCLGMAGSDRDGGVRARIAVGLIGRRARAG